MAEERPLLKELAPRLHSFLVDPFGRLWGGWKYPKEEKEEEKPPEGVRTEEIAIARRKPAGVVGVQIREIPALRKPEIEIEI